MRRKIILVGTILIVTITYCWGNITGVTIPHERRFVNLENFEQVYTSAYGVYVDEGYAFVAAGDAGLVVIDVIDPANPGQAIIQEINGNAFDIFVRGNYAYIASPNAGLVIMDISNPMKPKKVSSQSTSQGAYDVYVSGHCAYVSDYNNLAVIDVTDPANPGAPVYRATSGRNMGIFVSGDYAFVAGNSGIAIINVSDPDNLGEPIYRGSSSAEEVYVKEDFAFVGFNTLGLGIVNVTDPTNPGEPIYRTTEDNANGIFVTDNYAFIAAESAGLAIINITDPTNPGEPIYQSTDDSGYSVFVSGDYAFVADGSRLAIINVSDPTNPGTPIYPQDPIQISSSTTIEPSSFPATTTTEPVEDQITISRPEDITYVMGTIGNNITWKAECNNPSRLEVERDDIIILERSWNGSEITINIDHLSVGSYVFECTVWNLAGKWATDVVFVLVVQKTTTQTTMIPLISPGFKFLPAVIMLAMLIYLKRRVGCY